MSAVDSQVEARAAMLAPLFAALGDTTRLRLVARLAAGGPGSATLLSAHAAVSRQAIVTHLGVLEGVGLVRSERRGRERVWELHPDRLADAHAYLDEVSQQWDDALARLREFVEREDR